jgi:spermidine/putrescine transport system substrate-binding protein
MDNRERTGSGPREPALIDATFHRGLTEPRHSRRQFLMRAGAGLGALGMGGLLSACGIQGTEAAASADTFDWAAWWKRQKPSRVLNFANWPLYIDTSHGQHPSLEQFTKQTGIKVNYFEVIEDNAPFYANIEPSLKAGKPTGYDLIVMTDDDWTVFELVKLNRWITPLDHSRMPNFFKYASPLVRNSGYDPSNTYTAAWQSGFTGIAYDVTKIDREINSVHDLWDPAFKGHVGMMSDNTELGSAGLLAAGVDPAKSTPSDWKKAAALLTQQRDAGLVSQYYDQSYIKALETGDIWITQAWSGDIFQANATGFPHLKFVAPQEGVMLWTDTMMIPLHAQNPVSAMDWINFYYQPKIAAEVEDWVNYICPVPAAQKILRKEDPPVGNSALVFPTKAESSLVKGYYNYTTYAEYNAWNNVFNPVIES